ncbi:hypothetical protein HPG69_007516 [Diceros bicornis minor]|uniref:Uncharacterized protein n=1 Tax=Diceros bicornis minor TaxID=77932 RepID=A0A7J7FL08_DICBM|nr:hypothetical protein HPG69_007516 [Diceros bicornis minor]
MAAARGLWGCEDSNLWTAILARHGEVLRAHPDSQGRLEALDRWYRVELPAAIEDRAEKHVTLDDLKWLLAWKLVRGRFRPRLVTSNAPELVLQRSATAFRLLPDLQAAVRELSQNCAPSAAWAPPPPRVTVLAAGVPEEAAFISDEAVAAVLGLLALQYTLQALHVVPGWGAGVCHSPEQSTSGVWTPHHVETALWTWVVRQKLCPDLLPNLGPGPATPEGTRPAKKHRTQAD